VLVEGDAFVVDVMFDPGALYEQGSRAKKRRRALRVPRSPSVRHLRVSVLFLCLRGPRTGNPESVAPSPNKMYRDRLGCGIYANGTDNGFLNQAFLLLNVNFHF